MALRLLGVLVLLLLGTHAGGQTRPSSAPATGTTSLQAYSYQTEATAARSASACLEAASTAMNFDLAQGPTPNSRTPTAHGPSPSGAATAETETEADPQAGKLLPRNSFHEIQVIVDGQGHAITFKAPCLPVFLDGLQLDLREAAARQAKKAPSDARTQAGAGAAQTSGTAPNIIAQTDAHARWFFDIGAAAVLQVLGVDLEASALAVPSLSKQLMQVHERFRELLRDSCRRHFKHGGIGAYRLHEASSLLSDPMCEDVYEDLLQFYSGVSTAEARKLVSTARESPLVSSLLDWES